MSPQIEISYCLGCKVRISCPNGNIYKVEIWDNKNNKLLLSGLSYDDLHYAKTYLINYKVNIYLDSELIYSDVFELKDKRVKINFTSPSLGDTISWISQVDKFQKTNNCQVFVNIKNYKDLFLESYDNLNFIEYQPTEPPKGTTLIPGMNSLSCKKFNCFFDFCQCYDAEYDLGCFLGPDEVISEFTPCDIKDGSIQKAASDILGMEYEEIRTNILIKNKNSNFTKPYVCIAVQSTAQYKYWNNKNGWQVVCDYLISKGYDVVCIDKEKEFGFNDFVNKQPVGVIDKSGNIDLQDRITDIYNCEFFIGLGSGLSWLAWSIGKPVIMISGFSHPKSEFITPYRVFNDTVCNSCWNDKEIIHGNKPWEWCPKDKNFECSVEITPDMVIEKVNQLI
jgi:autotransporter strand-loop-strand O-heptosyltransferase